MEMFLHEAHTQESIMAGRDDQLVMASWHTWDIKVQFRVGNI